MIDRRELIQRAAMALGGALSASAVLGVLSGCAATPTPGGAGQKGKFFTAAEAQTVAAISDQIVPRTDTPGAVDVGVPAFIDRMMAGYYQDKERHILRAGLARIDKDAHQAHGMTFASLTPEQQIALMKVYDREAFEQNKKGGDKHAFRMLKELTTLGYFTSEPGATKALKYAAVPGPYKGDIPFSDVGKTWAL